MYLSAAVRQQQWEATLGSANPLIWADVTVPVFGHEPGVNIDDAVAGNGPYAILFTEDGITAIPWAGTGAPFGFRFNGTQTEVL
jgi:hypothetical protein